MENKGQNGWGLGAAESRDFPEHRWWGGWTQAYTHHQRRTTGKCSSSKECRGWGESPEVLCATSTCKHQVTSTRSQLQINDLGTDLSFYYHVQRSIGIFIWTRLCHIFGSVDKRRNLILKKCFLSYEPAIRNEDQLFSVFFLLGGYWY